MKMTITKMTTTTDNDRKRQAVQHTVCRLAIYPDFRLECGVWSAECGVWSAECGVRRKTLAL